MQEVKDVLAMHVPSDAPRMEQAYQAGKLPRALNVVFTNCAQPRGMIVTKIILLSVETCMGEAKDKVATTRSRQRRLDSLC